MIEKDWLYVKAIKRKLQTLIFFFFKDIFNFYLSICVHLPTETGRGCQILGAGVNRQFKLSGVGAGTRTWVLWKNN